MKRRISWLAVICMALNMIFLPAAFAEEGTVKNNEIADALKESIIFNRDVPEAFVYGEKLALSDGASRLCTVLENDKLYIPEEFCKKYAAAESSVQIDGTPYVLAEDFAKAIAIEIKSYGNVTVLAKNESVFKKAEKNIADIELLFGLFVSPDGKENASGTITNPLKDFSKAKTKAKNIAENIGFVGDSFTVYFRGGVYDIKESVVFGAKDSAPEGCTIIFDAYPGEEPIFNGGVSISGSEFTKVTSGTSYERLPASAKGHVYSVSLDKYNYKPISGEPINQFVMYDGEISTLARWPDYDNAKTGDAVKTKGTAGDPGVIFKYDDAEKISAWSTANDAWLNASFVYTWSNQNFEVKIDAAEGTVKTATNPAYQPIGKQKPFYIYNLIEELDAEGEYYIDRQNNVLYFYPYKAHVLNGSFAEKKVNIAVLSESMISLNNTSGISFRRLTFENTGEDIIDGESVKNIEIAGCTFRNNAGKGIEIVDGYDVLIKSNDIYNTGLNGIKIGGGNIANLTPSGNQVINNRIFNVLTKSNNGGAINTDYYSGYGMYVANNEIFNCPHFAISGITSGGTYEYNELYDTTTKDIADSGVVYSYMYPYCFDRKVQYNYIHDSWRGMSAVYLDNMTTDVNVKGNIFYRTSRPVYSNGSENSVIENNIMIDQVDSEYGNQGIMIASSEANGNVTWDPKTFTQLTGTNTGTTVTFLNRMKTFDIYSDYWREKNPYAIKIFERGYVDLPYETYLVNNISVRSGEATTDNAGKEVVEINNNYSFSEDIGFTDMENNNFNLKEDSKIYDIIPDFEATDFDRIGIYLDEYRTEMPEFNETFDMLVPADKSIDIDAVEVVFKWQPVQNTRKYRFILSDDKNFNHILRDEIVYGNVITIKNLRYDKSRYYWRVEALSMNSKNFPVDAKIKADSEYFSFTTAEKETVTFKKAEEALLEAKTFAETIVEGKNPGEYFEGSKDSLNKVIADFEEFIKEENISQREIDSNIEEFKKNVQSVKGKRNTETVALNDKLQILGDWSFQPNIGSRVGDGILFKRAAASDNPSGGYMTKIENYQTLKFRTKIDLNDGSGGKGWIYYGLRADNNTGSYSNTRLYFVVVNETMIELQRWGSGERLYLTWDNKYIESGKEYEIEYGAIDTEDGNVRIVFKVDGETVIDYVDDSENKILDSGYFTVYESRPGLSVYLLPAKEDE